MAYISNYLTHWIGKNANNDDERYDILINKIVRNKELKYNFNYIPFTSKYGGFKKKDSWGLHTICFTDIPLCDSEDHCNRYSKFGISFIKSFLANSCVAPVWYTISPFVYEAYSRMFHSLKNLEAYCINNNLNIPPGIFNVDDFMQRLHTFIAYYQDYDNPNNKFEYVENSLSPNAQQIDFFEKKNAFYFEREWRTIYRTGDNFPWNREKNGEHFFIFVDEAVKYIIIPQIYSDQAKKDILKYFTSGSVPVLEYEDLKKKFYT